MKKNLNGFAGNFLFVLNVFIIFLLIFEDKVAVPYWLQPLGRMHPMFLHFPIVILILAMFLEFFRVKSEYNAQDLYHRFASNLLIIGVISSGITVIMGLFLSREEGYEGALLEWHKWTGVSIVFISSLIYWSRNKSWYRGPVAKGAAILASISLIVAGHYGAALTHGENFIFEPILPEAEKVSLEEALVFDDVIKPIFQQKCISCHNPDKIKGRLILTDSSSILKGGKSGELFVAGKPELSLLLERIHLPLDEKKHMPPAGKVQLTDEEVEILFHWVKSNAGFNKKLVDLPATDSLRMIAAAQFEPADKKEEVFDFASADEKTVKKLNNNYRVIYPLTKESPALVVNLYNRSTYKPSVLTELKDIKKQIVSLDLNKMPVKDTELKTIGEFANLRKLNLNFTDVTGKGLKELSTLKQLKSLSISGTKVTYPELQELVKKLKSLTTLTIWNTGVKDEEIANLRKLNKEIELIAGFRDDGSSPIQLTPPLLKNSSTIFSKPLQVQLKHPIHGVEIRYTVDGSEPDSVNSPLFKNETVLKENTTIKARAFKKGWIGSKEVAFSFHKSAFKPDSVVLLKPMEENNRANGTRTFFDGQLGNFELKRGNSDKWAGYLNNDMELLLEFKQPKVISSVSLNTMLHPEANIYPPMAFEVWGGISPDDMKLLSSVKPPLADRDSKPVLKVIDSKFKPQNLGCIKIIAKPLKTTKGKGSTSFLFVDEIFMN